MSKDTEHIDEVKARLADKYTAAELCELLEVPVEDIIEEYWENILDKGELFEEELGEEECASED